MKKIITLISILLLISMSACSDGSSNTLGPNNGGNNTEENEEIETGSQIRHSAGTAYCTEYEVRENSIHVFGENEGKCPAEYSIKCAKFYNNLDRKIIEQAMFPKSAGENACEWYGGLDDGYVHHY